MTIQDYEGPNAAFIAGRLEGRGVLDGIRATLKFSKLGLANPKIAIWVRRYPSCSDLLLICILGRVTPVVVPLPDGASRCIVMRFCVVADLASPQLLPFSRPMHRN